MPKGKYESGTKVTFKDITEFEGAYENSEDKQNRDRDKQQGIK
jgi:hypothetical protein